MQQSKYTRAFTTAAAIAVVACTAVWVYKKFTEAEESVDTSVKSPDATLDKKEVTSPHIDLKKAARENVLQLLKDIVSIQNQLGATMKEVIQKVVTNHLSPDETYNLVANQQPMDPLEKNGLSIADFDALLDRFSADEEVHAAIMEVVQGPDQTTGATAASHLDSPQSTLTVEKIVEINLAMLKKFTAVMNHFKEQMKSDPKRYQSRTVSIAAQALVGAFVQCEFNVSADDVERAMLLHQVELSTRPDFLAANDEIQQIMADCVHLDSSTE